MSLLSVAAVLIVAALQGVIALVEILFWTREPVYTRLERLAFTRAEAIKVAPIVANAGLYNGFLAAGLIWGVFAQSPPSIYFFLSCVALAGLFGAATLKPTTLVLQTLPAAAAALAVWAAKPLLG
jgi:putative membrane protein